MFSDRPDAPGQMSFVDDAVTVRETPDNLDKIARVLAQFDRPTLSVRLHFQIIQADGAARSDPAISAGTTVSLRAGQTAVLGNARLSAAGGTVILTVKPELVSN